MGRLIARIYNLVFRQGIQLDRMRQQLMRMERMLNDIHIQVMPDDAVSLGLTVDEPTEQKEKQ